MSVYLRRHESTLATWDFPHRSSSGALARRVSSSQRTYLVWKLDLRVAVGTLPCDDAREPAKAPAQPSTEGAPSMSHDPARRRQTRTVVALFSAFSLATGLAFVAPASADDRDEAAPTILPGPVSSEAPRSDDAYPEADLLTLPVVDDQMQQDAVMMAERLEGHDRLASVGISLDRSTIEVYWYGEEQTDLNRVLDEVSSPVALRSSTYSPKELREAWRISAVVATRPLPSDRTAPAFHGLP